MSFDGSIPCWIPDVPIQENPAWRLKIARFGDGYQQRMLDGINALDLSWDLQWVNRTKDDLLAMDAFLINEGASSFQFRDPPSQELYTVFCNEWSINWAPARRVQGEWVYYGTLSATFEKANGVGIPGGGSAGAPPLTVVRDTFTDADGTLLTAHVGEVGASWALHAGAAPVPLIEANRVQPTGGISYWSASGIPPTPNYYVEAEIDYLTNDPADSVGIAGRMVATNTFYFAGWSRAANAWGLYRDVGGVQTQLGALVADTFTSARIARLDLRGNTITLLVNSQPVVTISDTMITAAGVTGIRYAAALGPAAGRQITRFEVVAL